MATASRRLHHADSALFRQFPDGFEIILGRNGHDAVYGLTPGIPPAFRKRDLIPQTPAKAAFPNNINSSSSNIDIKNSNIDIISNNSNIDSDINGIQVPDYPLATPSIILPQIAGFSPSLVYGHSPSPAGTGLDSAIDSPNSSLPEQSYSYTSIASNYSLQAASNGSPQKIRSVSSSSRIPVSRASPIPIPVKMLNRTIPLHLTEKDSVVNDMQPTTSHDRQSSTSRRRSEPDLHVQETIPMMRTVVSQSQTRGRPRPPSPSTACKLSRRISKSIPSFSPRRPKTPTGPPPWLIPQHSPQSHLPPNQQIVPTVARRLEATRIAQMSEDDPTLVRIWDRCMNPMVVQHCIPQPQSKPSTRPLSKETQNQILEKLVSREQVSATSIANEFLPTFSGSASAMPPQNTIDETGTVMLNHKRKTFISPTDDMGVRGTPSPCCCVIS